MQGMCDCNTVWVRGAVSRIDDTTPGRKPHNINDDRVSSQVITLFYCKYQTQERGQAILLSTTPSLHCAARLSKRSMHMAWWIFQTAAFIIWFWPPKAMSFPETLVSFTLKRKKKKESNVDDRSEDHSRNQTVLQWVGNIKYFSALFYPAVNIVL